MVASSRNRWQRSLFTSTRTNPHTDAVVALGLGVSKHGMGPGKHTVRHGDTLAIVQPGSASGPPSERNSWQQPHSCPLSCSVGALDVLVHAPHVLVVLLDQALDLQGVIWTFN